MSAMRGLWKRIVDRCQRRSHIEEVSAELLKQRLASGQAIQILDIRNAAAFQQGHLPDARHLPLERLLQELASLDPSLPTVVY
jgi:rhodanese-related sulfurtransferase